MDRAGATAMPPTSVTSRQGGFTLLELIVGLTVGAILLSAIYATFVGVSQTQRRVENVLDRTATWRFVTETLRLDLARVKGTSTFKGNVEGFEVEFFQGIKETPITVHYGWEDARLTRTAGKAIMTVDMPEGFQQPAFNYRIDANWVDSADTLPRAVELRIATPRGALSRAFALEFDAGPKSASGDGSG
jgi:prepilin-type N-terminal cleavage/methylation domain-containing protein